MENNKTLRYFLYARKSSESEDRQMASIQDQEIEVKKIADELDLNIVGTFSESKSAKAPGRTVFNEMLLRIEKGEADAILCWKLNRLARNPVDGGKISWMLQNNIIKHVQCFGRDYKPSDNVLMMQVELGMANQFVKDLSVDVKRGMRQKAERGWNPFSILPIGYIHAKDHSQGFKNNEIIIDKKRFPIVKKLWQLMITADYSIGAIKREADRLGLVNRYKKPYAVNTFHKLFSNEFYYGYFYWKDVNGIQKRHKGHHKPMISEADFNTVQKRLGNHRRPTRKKQYDYTFRGLLSCGECGCNITAERKLQVRCSQCRYKFSCINRKDCPKCSLSIVDMDCPTRIDIIYYRCTKRKQPCSQKTVSEKVLELQYFTILKQIEIQKEFYDFVIETIKILNINEQPNDLKVIQLLRKQKSELEKRLKGIALMRADGDIEKDQYLKMKEETLNSIQSLEKQINTYKNKSVDWTKVAKDYMNFALNATNVLKESDPFIKRNLLLKLGSNQTLLDRKLTFIRAKPLLALKELQGAYDAEKTRFEPKNRHINKGDSKGYDTLNAYLLAPLRNVRTSIIDS
ncbi:recombinase family protein [Dokdonia sp.]|uniref:recombinase family protein n=1 Tax=Dokdonia sp. TaxID=2024995 RepID=UPI003265761E